eukprot:Tbor_TRINITY_DN6122_c4_g3::TRINITY_DN6122_c4_g3_i1::g.22777::m.22777
MNRKQFDETYRSIRNLSAEEGPSRNIFEPKYQARSQMHELMKAIANVSKEDKKSENTTGLLEAQVQLAKCHHFLGDNMLETEEEKDGFKQLYIAYTLILSSIDGQLRPLPVKVRDEKTDKDDETTITLLGLEDILKIEKPYVNETTGYEYIVEYLQILNSIGVHMSSGESSQRIQDAKKVLVVAEMTYRAWDKYFMEKNSGPTIDDLVIKDGGQLDLDTVPKEKHEIYNLRLKMDCLYTSTLFFLAQAYTMIDVPTASKYAHLTMVHQLKTKSEFKKKTWAVNALHLSGFYIENRDYARGMHCLEAGKAMMKACTASKEAPDDDETTGQVIWAYGRFYLSRLRYYESLFPNTAAAEEVKVDQFGSWFVPFPLDLPPIVPMKPITTLEAAVAEFKCANKFFQEAMEKYFLMDGQCNDYILIRQDITNLYKYLASFEPDMNRKIAMHMRRIDQLLDIPDQLNEQAYLTTIRQLQFDIGDIYNDILDLRLKQKKAEPQGSLGKPLSDNSFNRLNEKAVSWYTKFLKTYDAEKGAEVRVAVFRAKMRVCALVTKKFFKDAKEEYEAVGEAAKMYGDAVNYAKTNPLPSELSEEVELAKQMHEFLPSKQTSIMKAYVAEGGRL